MGERDQTAVPEYPGRIAGFQRTCQPSGFLKSAGS